MIQLLTDSLPDVPDDTPFGCKILSAARVYGLKEPFEQFWVQDGGTIVAKLDTEAILLEKEGADAEELCAFLRTLDLKTLCCPEETAGHLVFPVSRRGEIMVLHPQEKNAGKSMGADEKAPGPREIYSLLEQAHSEDFPVPEFEPFYLDLSFRTRHGAALSSGVTLDGLLAACAVCTSVTDHAAVISAVVCAPDFRHRGLAGTAVRDLITRLNRPDIYIFRAEGENEEFYRSLGFRHYENWANLETKERGEKANGKANKRQTL
jgi:GNAT superfamily N-acetyltransferase